MRESEYGGSDTEKTYGIQPAPHKLEGHEKTRMMYKTDPMEEDPLPNPGLRID